MGTEGYGGYSFNLKPFVDIVKGSSCKLVVSEEITLSAGDITSKTERALLKGKKSQDRTMTITEYSTRAANWFSEGADGIQIFNASAYTALYKAIDKPAVYLNSLKRQ